MATNGIISSSSYNQRSIQLFWSIEQNASANTSTMTWRLQGAGTSATGYSSCNFSVVIDGSTVYSSSTSTKVTLYNKTLIASGTKEIAHDTDGTKWVTFHIKGAIGGTAQNVSAQQTFKLNSIVRASTMKQLPEFTMGSEGTISLDYVYDTNFTHTFMYYFGDTSDSGIASGKGFKGKIVSRTIERYVDWTPPKEFANAIPNATSAKGMIVCDTYDGNVKIGSTSRQYTCNVPDDIKPVISKPTITVVNSNSVVKGWGVFVSGYSKAKVTATAIGSFGSTISNITLSGAYSKSVSAANLSYTGDVLNSGTKTFTVVTKDSRGRTSSSASESITVYGYGGPTITSFIVSRNSFTGSAMVIDAKWNYSSIGGNNSVTATLQYKKEGTSSWITYGTVSYGSNDVALSDGFAEDAGYNFKLIVKDKLGSSAQQTDYVGTTSVLIDLRSGGKGLGIGKVTESDSLEVNMPALFFNTLQYTRSNISYPFPIMQIGKTTITPSAANTPTSETITFDNKFPTAPYVFVSAATSYPGTEVLGCGVNEITTTSFNCWLTRTNTANTTVFWMAVAPAS